VVDHPASKDERALDRSNSHERKALVLYLKSRKGRHRVFSPFHIDPEDPLQISGFRQVTLGDPNVVTGFQERVDQAN
jgi:hypothetical protein